jgi:hypothetical protein
MPGSRIMDTSLISAFISAQVGQFQLAVAAQLMKTNTDSASSAANLIDAAQQNLNPLANVSAGIGANLDISA